MSDYFHFEQFNVEQKLAALTEVAKHGEEGVLLLNQSLEDDNLRVRAHAYRQLKDLGITSAALERGIPLRVADCLCTVYQSVIFQDPVDGWWFITDGITQKRCKECAIDAWEFIEENGLREYKCGNCPYHTGKDSAGSAFEYVSDLEVEAQQYSYTPRLIAYHVERPTAEVDAEKVYLEAFSKLPCPITSIYPREKPTGFDLRAWVEANGVIFENDSREWNSFNHIHLFEAERRKWGYFDREYTFSVLTNLQYQGHFNLVREIWQQLGYQSLAFVRKFVVDRPCYLRSHRYCQTNLRGRQ